MAFIFCQAGLEGSENTDLAGYRDGMLMGVVVAVLQAFPCDLGTWIGTSASVAGGCAKFPAS